MWSIQVSIKSEYRKTLVVRGLQMLVIGFIFNVGVTIIGVLALIQFFWMLFTKERNNFIADLGATMKNWFGEASEFLLGSSEYKPFPWSKF